MPPRNHFLDVLRVVALALLVLVVFAVTALAVGAPAAWYKDIPLGSTPGIFLAVLCGLIVWLFVAVFLFKRETILLPVHDRAAMAAGLKRQITELGYTLAEESANVLVFKPSFQSYRFGGAIRVEVEEPLTKVIGPKVYLERIRAGFRVQCHIDKVTRTVRERAVPDGVGRVQITLHVPGQQWRAVYKQVLDLLDKQGLDASAVHVLEEAGASRVLPAISKPAEPVASPS